MNSQKKKSNVKIDVIGNGEISAPVTIKESPPMIPLTSCLHPGTEAP